MLRFTALVLLASIASCSSDQPVDATADTGRDAQPEVSPPTDAEVQMDADVHQDGQ
jgi:hypothetical protein